jgi:hypothetical protein
MACSLCDVRSPRVPCTRAASPKPKPRSRTSVDYSPLMEHELVRYFLSHFPSLFSVTDTCDVHWRVWPTSPLPPAPYKRQQSHSPFSCLPELASLSSSTRSPVHRKSPEIAVRRRSSPEPQFVAGATHSPSVVEPCSPPGRTPSNSSRRTREPKVDDDPNYFVYFIKHFLIWFISCIFCLL